MIKKILLVGAAVVVLVGVGGYVYFSRPVKAPSQVSVPQQTVTSTGTSNTTPSSSVPAIAPEQGQTVYHLTSENSMASFTLGEVLRGEPVMVVGTTTEVMGDVAVDRTNLSAAKIGLIRINARTLKTDSAQRNGAIARMILKSEDDANEFIDFKPTEIKGLPATIDIGQPFEFEVIGDLTISGQTHAATFKGSARFVSDEELAGTADTMVHYADYGLAVPNFPFLANVDQDVKLSIQFSAKK